ncbi:MAG: hypothetical protein GY861_04235 [bacterium]|nr:hypothetical protein [bacterium]
MAITDYQKAVLEELLVRLNGSCSDEIRTCPIIIARSLGIPGVWSRDDCFHEFLSLADTPQEYDEDEFVSEDDTFRGCNYNCPCIVVDYSILEAKIYELIEEVV